MWLLLLPLFLPSSAPKQIFVRYQMLLGSGYKTVPKIDTAPTLKELPTCNANLGCQLH